MVFPTHQTPGRQVSAWSMSNSLGIWEAKKREVSEVQVMNNLHSQWLAPHRGEVVHCLWLKHSRTRQLSAHKSAVCKWKQHSTREQTHERERQHSSQRSYNFIPWEADVTGWGRIDFPRAYPASKLLFKSVAWWLRARLKVSLGPTWSLGTNGHQEQGRQKCFQRCHDHWEPHREKRPNQAFNGQEDTERHEDIPRSQEQWIHEGQGHMRTLGLELQELGYTDEELIFGG